MSGLSEPGHVLLCTGSVPDGFSWQSIPSLPGKERPGCVAFILAAPPGRYVSDKPARCSHRGIAARKEMARILLEVSVNTGRPHPRLLFRESCDRAVVGPDQYGSDAQRTSDYGDLIKGLLGCQPIPVACTRLLEPQRAAIHPSTGTSGDVRKRGVDHSNAENQWSPGRRTRPAPLSASASRRCAAIRSSSCCAWSKRRRTRCSLSSHRSRRTDASINRSSSS